MLVSNTYARYYDGISAYGEGKVSVSDITYHSKEDFMKDPTPVSFILDPGVTEVEPGVLDIFLPLKQLEIADTVRSVGVTEETLKIFKENDVTVRGSFDSYAEEFAKKYHLHFLHRDMTIGQTGDYFDHGVYIITLCFTPDGKPFIHQDCRCQGSSAGSTGGGETSFDLPRDFYKTHTAEDIADLCWGCCYSQIKSSSDLQHFLEGAKKRGGCDLRY